MTPVLVMKNQFAYSCTSVVVGQHCVRPPFASQLYKGIVEQDFDVLSRAAATPSEPPKWPALHHFPAMQICRRSSKNQPCSHPEVSALSDYQDSLGLEYRLRDGHIGQTAQHNTPIIIASKIVFTFMADASSEIRDSMAAPRA